MLSCHGVMLSYVKCLWWSLGHSEQLLFSCLYSKVTVYDCLSWCHVMLSYCHGVMLSYVKCLCWSLGHGEQLLFSCLCSKVTVYDCLSCCHFMVSCCHRSSAYGYHWDMLNNFCFHVYAQKSLFIFPDHCASQLLNTLPMFSWNHVTCQMLMLILGTCWATFVFMSRLKTECL